MRGAIPTSIFIAAKHRPPTRPHPPLDVAGDDLEAYRILIARDEACLHLKMKTTALAVIRSARHTARHLRTSPTRRAVEVRMFRRRQIFAGRAHPMPRRRMTLRARDAITALGIKRERLATYRRKNLSYNLKKSASTKKTLSYNTAQTKTPAPRHDLTFPKAGVS